MMHSKRRIILDTNFLLLPGQSKFDVFEELEKTMNEPYELFIIDKTIEELEKLEKIGKVKDRIAAKIALELLPTKKIKQIKTSKDDRRIVDDVIIGAADENTIVATIDKNLKKELLKRGHTIIEVVNKGFLRIKRSRMIKTADKKVRDDKNVLQG